MNRYEMAQGKNKGSKLFWYVQDLIKKSKCPFCGERVYMAKEESDAVYKGTKTDPMVFCRNGNHWTGLLSKAK
jgi:hypothetical protein